MFLSTIAFVAYFYYSLAQYVYTVIWNSAETIPFPFFTFCVGLKTVSIGIQTSKSGSSGRHKSCEKKQEVEKDEKEEDEDTGEEDDILKDPDYVQSESESEIESDDYESEEDDKRDTKTLPKER